MSAEIFGGSSKTKKKGFEQVTLPPPTAEEKAVRDSILALVGFQIKNLDFLNELSNAGSGLVEPLYRLFSKDLAETDFAKSARADQIQRNIDPPSPELGLCHGERRLHHVIDRHLLLGLIGAIP